VRVGIIAYPLGPGGHGSILAPDHRVRRPCRHGRWCRTRLFNPAIRWQLEMPKYLCTDHDPLYRLHQWLANLRVLDVTEIKTVPYVPLSHPFVERLIGTLRRECLDRTLFWTTADLEAKLLDDTAWAIPPLLHYARGQVQLSFGRVVDQTRLGFSFVLRGVQ